MVKNSMKVREWAEQNEKFFSVICIGFLTAIISLCQLIVMFYQVSDVNTKNRYEALKTMPHIEVIRRSDSAGDYMEVVNHGGEMVYPSGEVYSFLSVQANVKPIPINTLFYKSQYFSRMKKYEGEKDNIIIHWLYHFVSTCLNTNQYRIT